MKKITTILLSLILILPAFAAAQPIALESIFSAEEMAAMRKGKILSRAYLKGGQPINIKNRSDLIMPRSKYIGDFSNYEMVADEKMFIPYELTDANRLEFYNMLAAHSRLSSMMYYSRAEKKRKQFIMESYSVEPVQKERRIDDPFYSSIEKKQVSYFKVQDNRLGEIVFKCDLYSDGDTFVVKNTSTVVISRYGVLLSSPGEYQIINLFVYDRKAGGFYYYALHALRINSSVLLNSGMLSTWSFANRLRAGTVHLAGLLGMDITENIKVVEEQQGENTESVFSFPDYTDRLNPTPNKR